MLRLGILFTALLQCISCFCPSGYTLEYNGICIKLADNGGSHILTNMHTDAVNICNPDGATPVLIRSQEEQDYWTNIVSNYSHITVLGLRCNKTTSVWEWDDGSKAIYSPSAVSSLLSGNCVSQGYIWAMQPSGDWSGYSPNTGNWSVEIFCMKQLPPILPSDDQCGDFNSDDGACYQVVVTAETWKEAQTICKSFGGNIASVHDTEENSYIRRLAVSRGQVNGVLIGATISGKSNNFSWIDGTPWDYNNMMPGFPIDGMGDCLAMVTNEVGGHWVNVNCSEEMPYACVRRSTDIEPSCGNSVYIEGEIIYSPGFPSNASVPCDYFLVADTNKLVELEIILLEANSCCDRLILTEGSLGGNVIANLTVEVVEGSKYRTKSSNLMRVSWQPTSGVNVRGMMITFRGV